MTFQSILDEIQNNLNKVLSEMSIADVNFSVEPAKPGFGDVSSNIAFYLQNNLKKVLKILLNFFLRVIIVPLILWL